MKNITLHLLLDIPPIYVAHEKKDVQYISGNT